MKKNIMKEIRNNYYRTLNNCRFYEKEGKTLSLLNEIGTLRGILYAMECVDKCPATYVPRMCEDAVHFIRIQNSLIESERGK